MRRLVIAAAALVAAAGITGVAIAITGGGPDGNGHPAVGALLAPHAFSDGTWEECTGTLISSTVFLTAAHCDLGLSRVAVTFDSNYDSTKGTTYWGTWHADPKCPEGAGRPVRHRGGRSRSAGRRHSPGEAPDAQLAGQPEAGRHDHGGRLRRAVRHHGQRRSDLPLRGHPLCRDRIGQRDELGLDPRVE